MPEYGPCQVRNCDEAARYSVQFQGQPRDPLRCCSDCAEELAAVNDEVTRLSAR